MAAKFVPDRGDIVWLDFDPQAGYEQAGRRPALVLTPKAYNSKAGLALICPITSKVKGYPFEVAVNGKKIGGVVLSDQVRSLDWAARKAERISAVDEDTMAEVLAKIAALIAF